MSDVNYFRVYVHDAAGQVVTDFYLACIEATPHARNDIPATFAYDVITKEEFLQGNLRVGEKVISPL